MTAPKANGRRFAVQLVLEDPAGRRLRRSKRHGELTVSAAEQWAQLVYPRQARIYQRKFDQPLKVLASRRTLRVYSGNGKRSFMWDGCRMLSESDVVACMELFRDMGADVLAIREPCIWTPDASSGSEGTHLISDCDAAMRVLQDKSNDELVRSFVESYADSSQRREDASAILRTIFG